MAKARRQPSPEEAVLEVLRQALGVPVQLVCLGAPVNLFGRPRVIGGLGAQENRYAIYL